MSGCDYISASNQKTGIWVTPSDGIANILRDKIRIIFFGNRQLPLRRENTMTAAYSGLEDKKKTARSFSGDSALSLIFIIGGTPFVPTTDFGYPTYVSSPTSNLP